MERRIITTEATEEDVRIETTLRPQCLSDYVGQEKIKSTLKIYIEAAKAEGSLRSCIILRPQDLERPPFPVSLPTRWEAG